MKVIVGLGNPGAKYEATRHNVGFRVVDRLAAGLRAPFRASPTALIATGKIADCEVTLVKPSLYMNRSGPAIRSLFEGRSPSSDELLIVLDDIDLPLGSLRLRVRGGDGGHRGLRSLIDTFGISELPRLRVGVGRPLGGASPEDYVLEPFSKGEESEIAVVVDRAAEAVRCFVVEGAEPCMNRFNSISDGG